MSSASLVTQGAGSRGAKASPRGALAADAVDVLLGAFGLLLVALVALL